MKDKQNGVTESMLWFASLLSTIHIITSSMANQDCLCLVRDFRHLWFDIVEHLCPCSDKTWHISHTMNADNTADTAAYIAASNSNILNSLFTGAQNCCKIFYSLCSLSFHNNRYEGLTLISFKTHTRSLLSVWLNVIFSWSCLRTWNVICFYLLMHHWCKI